jgi:TnpA family transposase
LKEERYGTVRTNDFGDPAYPGFPSICYSNPYYERAVTLYTHSSAQYSVFGTRAISCSAREALYVLDGLLENDTILRPHEHSTDTHGFTEQLFGLCYLLGYSFMPRLRDLGDQQLYRVDPDT